MLGKKVVLGLEIATGIILATLDIALFNSVEVSP